MKLPQARLDVLRTDLEGEVVLYDPERHLAHSLNLAAGAIWNHCDGQNDLAGLQRLVSDELGVPVTSDDLSRDFDQLAGWDSVYLLHLAMLLERETGRPVSLPELLEARNLEAVYTAAVT